MNPLSFIYTEFLWRPLFNGLVLFYNILPWHDLGLAVVLLTVAVRAVSLPLTLKAQKAQKDLARIQPHIKKIQEDHKGNRELQGKALMELYAEHRVNPFSGCLLILLQLPVLIALFQVFRGGLDASLLSYLYSFIANPGTIDPISLGILDLSRPSVPLGVVAAITQYFQSRLSMPPQPPEANQFSKAMSWQTQYIFPALLLVWAYTFPAALILYWTVSNILGIVQEIAVRRFTIR